MALDFAIFFSENLEDESYEMNMEELGIGEDETNENDWPWLVALFFSNTFLCGGTLVSDKHVISGEIFRHFWKLKVSFL